MMSEDNQSLDDTPDLREAFLLCNNTGKHALDIASFLELTTSLQVNSTQENLTKIYHSTNSMTYNNFKTIFYNTLINLRGDNVARDDVSMNSDYLRQIVALALVTLSPSNATTETTNQVNRISQVTRMLCKQNKQLQESLNRVTHESKLFRLQVERELNKRSGGVQHNNNGSLVNGGAIGSTGPKVVAEFQRHIAAQQEELGEKQQLINELQQEKRRMRAAHNEEIVSLEEKLEEQLADQKKENKGLHRQVEELEATLSDVEYKLNNENKLRVQSNADFDELQKEYQDAIAKMKSEHEEVISQLQSDEENNNTIHENTIVGLENEIRTVHQHAKALVQSNLDYEKQQNKQYKLLVDSNLKRDQLYVALEEEKKIVEREQSTNKKLRDEIEKITETMLKTKNTQINVEIKLKGCQQELTSMTSNYTTATTANINLQTQVNSMKEEKNRWNAEQRKMNDEVKTVQSKYEQTESRLNESKRDVDELRHQLNKEKENFSRVSRELDLLKVTHKAALDENLRNEDQHRLLEKDVERLKRLLSASKKLT